MNKNFPVLEVQNLAVELGGRRVLTHTTMCVRAGELIGPNGAGKTTLLRTILGLLRPVEGTAMVGSRTTRPGRNNIGYVPQRHEFAWEYPLSIAAVVMSGLTGKLGIWKRPGQQEWDDVMEALARVHISDLADRPVGQLSGGQRQRVLVARALALHPQLLLLDEPLNGLDMPTQELLGELFHQLAQENCAVVMTTHDLAAALYSCDRIILLNRTIRAEGNPHELCRKPEAWMETFGVGKNNPLLRIVEAYT